MIWCQTLEGGAFDLLNPTPEMISWRTVAIVLSRTSRFGGHTLLGPYSVAQHCVEGARAILRDTGRRDWAAAFLLHDVHEAFIGDIMTPVAKAIGALAAQEMGCETGEGLVAHAIEELKRRIDVAVYDKAGLPFWWFDAEAATIIKEYDIRMAITERNERLSARPHPWHSSIEKQQPVEGCDLTPWGEALAAALWTTAFLELVRPSSTSEIAIPAPGDDAACECSRCGAVGTLNSPPPPCDNCDTSLHAWKGWPDSPAPVQSIPLGTYILGSDGVYRKESEDIWR